MTTPIEQLLDPGSPLRNLPEGFGIGAVHAGRMVARIVVPRCELHELAGRISGVQEAPPSAFLAPGHRVRHNLPDRVAARALGQRDWTPLFGEGTRVQVRQNPFRLGNPLYEHRGPSRRDRRLGRRRAAPSKWLLDPREVAVLNVVRPNGYINLGLHFVLDRIFNINTPATSIGFTLISNDTTTVVATTLLIDPSPGAGSPDSQAIGTGVGAAAASRSGNTVTGSSGWEPADFSTVFPVTKVGFSTGSTDAGDDTVPTVQGVVNIIGGTGGSAPYNEPFTIDLTTVSDFDLTLQQQHTAQAT